MNLPFLSANPFDVRALNSKNLELRVGRDDLFVALANNIRLISPRVVAVVGEKGSGRSSLIHSVAATTEQVHRVFWPENDQVTTILHQMYCDLMNDFETPAVHSVLINRLEEELAGNSGYLPLIIFDHPHLPGPELAEVLTKLMPVLTRLRALTLISLTPGQKAGFSEELLSEMDVTPPLELFSREEITSLINKRFRKASNSSWTAPQSLVDMVMDESSGHVGRAMRFLRDFIDYSRGMPIADARKIDLKVKLSPNPPTEVEDPTFQRVAEASPNTNEVEVEIRDTIEELPPEPIPEMEEERTPYFPSLSEAAELWSESNSDEELEGEGEPQFDSDTEMEIIDEEIQQYSDIEESYLDEPIEPMDEIPIEEEDDNADDSISWKQEFSDMHGGAEMLEMQPGTEPSSVVSKFGGLHSRMKKAEVGLSAANRGVPKRGHGPLEAKPNEDNQDPNQLHQVETNDRNVDLWVQDGVDSPLFKGVKPTVPNQTVPNQSNTGEEVHPLPQQVRPLNEKVIDETNPTEVLAALSNMRRVAPPVEPTVTLDINALMNLGNAELVILEQALEREISPSDDFLQQELLVGRPRLSQLFNGLLKSGILTVRKQGRSRLFRISSPAKDHLSNLSSGGE